MNALRAGQLVFILRHILFKDTIGPLMLDVMRTK